MSIFPFVLLEGCDFVELDDAVVLCVRETVVYDGVIDLIIVIIVFGLGNEVEEDVGVFGGRIVRSDPGC